MSVVNIPVDITLAELARDLVQAARKNGYDVTWVNAGDPYADPKERRMRITLHVVRREA